MPVVFELAGHFIFGQANDDLPTLRSRECASKGGMQLANAASSLRPHIVQVMAARQGRILTTEDIYGLVADLDVAGFNPNAKRDRNLVNTELSDLAGCTTQGHSKPSPQLIIRVSRGRYLYREPARPMDVALLQECLERVEVYEKRPARRRRVTAIAVKTCRNRCGWRCTRCRGAFARAVASTSLIISGLRWTTSWR